MGVASACAVRGSEQGVCVYVHVYGVCACVCVVCVVFVMCVCGVCDVVFVG